MVSRSRGQFATAARVAAELVERVMRQPPAAPMLLNVNVPDVPYEALGGMQVTRLGKRHKAQPAIPAVNPRGETVYWVGAAGGAQDAGAGTDFHAVEHGSVSVTPLQMDLTFFDQLPMLSDWLRS